MSNAIPGGDDRPMWFTSSYSNGAGGECVECAVSGRGALVRDSKRAGELVVSIGSGAWRSFVRAVREDTQG
jgi:hypothetical protein